MVPVQQRKKNTNADLNNTRKQYRYIAVKIRWKLWFPDNTEKHHSLYVVWPIWWMGCWRKCIAITRCFCSVMNRNVSLLWVSPHTLQTHRTLSSAGLSLLTKTNRSRLQLTVPVHRREWGYAESADGWWCDFSTRKTQNPWEVIRELGDRPKPLRGNSIRPNPPIC